MRIDIRDSKYSVIYNEKTGAVEDVLWCNESAEVGRTMSAKHRRWNERLHDEKLWEVSSHEDRHSGQ